MLVTLRKLVTLWVCSGSACLLALPEDHGYSDHSIDLVSSGSVVIGVDEGRTFRLPKKVLVHRVTIRSEAVDTQHAQAEVWINGKREGILFAPGQARPQDPLDSMEVGYEASEIKLRGTSYRGQIGKIRILELSVEYSSCDQARPCEPCQAYPEYSWQSPCGDGDSVVRRLGGSNVLANIALEVNQIADALDNHLDWDEWGQLMLPIKEAAFDLETATNYSDLAVLSEEAKLKATALVNRIEAVKPCLTRKTTINREADRMIRRLVTLSNALRNSLSIR